MNHNAFDMTKASDCSDEEINALWVDTEKTSLVDLLEPTSQMPVVVSGGKGSGKTHLLRYSSLPLQVLRFGSLRKAVENEGYLGVYCACSSLDSSRFKGKGIAEDQWADAFNYYVELWLAQLMVQGFHEFQLSREITPSLETTMVNDILQLLLELPAQAVKPQTVAELVPFLKDLQKAIDQEVSNAAFTRRLNLRILAKPGRLIYGIPRIAARTVEFLSKVQFLYLLDELENFTQPQQRYVQTLLRDRQTPVSFRLGALGYGMLTHQTLGTEVNKPGSEFIPLFLDEKLRALGGEYQQFAKKVCLKRLSVLQKWDLNMPVFDRLFGGSTESQDTLVALTEQACKNVSRDSLPHLVRLRQILRLAAISESAVAPLYQPDAVLIEKFNIFMFYRGLANGEVNSTGTAELLVRKIRKDCDIFRSESGRIAGDYVQTFEHYKADLAAQIIYASARHSIPLYYGLNNFIRMSEGMTRNLLTIIKLIFKWAAFAGETVGSTKSISGSSLSRGVKDASDWFYDDARDMGKSEADVRVSLSRLAELLRAYRFSDRPTEVSVVCISFDWNEISEAARESISLCENWSLLIRVGSRKVRNSHKLNMRYQLNRMLCPRWHLPISRRGSLDLTAGELNSIFDPAESERFESTLAGRLQTVNYPFGREPRGPLQLELDF